MNNEEKKSSLNSLESIIIADILEELISGLQLYSYVIPKEIQRPLLPQSPLETVPYCRTSADEIESKSDSVGKARSNSSEEAGYSSELDNLRQIITQVQSKSNNEFDPFDFDISDLETETLSESMKIHQDLSFLLKLIRNTKSELQSSNGFSYLQQKVADEDRHLKEELILESHLKSKKEDVKRVQREIAQFEKESLENEQEEICQINNLKDQLHLLKQQGESDKSFTKVWLTARNEHERLGHKDEISTQSSRMKSIRTQITRDCDSYENVTAWTKLVSAKLEQKIRDWKNKFESDVHSIEQKIHKKRKNIEEQQERIASLEATIGERMVELAPWDEEKVQEKLQRLDYMRRYYSCRKIQRWWRKYMISHGLYKKKKPKPKATKPIKKGK